MVTGPQRAGGTSPCDARVSSVDLTNWFRLATAKRRCSRHSVSVMRLRLSGYVAFIALLSLASAACLLALGSRYAGVDVRYQLSFGSYASLTYPALICSAFWIWWKNRYLRVAGCCVAMLLFLFCAGSLNTGPIGGDMDFGAPFIATVAAMGCFLLSVIAFALAWILAFIWPTDA